MIRSLIQVANQSNQTVAANSIIGLGSVQRRFGCNCRLSGNGIELDGQGYYTVDAKRQSTYSEQHRNKTYSNRIRNVGKRTT